MKLWGKRQLEEGFLLGKSVIKLIKLQSQTADIWFCQIWWPFTKNLCLVKFGSHTPRGRGGISFFISYVTSCGHVIIGSSLPSLVTISLVEVEIWSVLIFNVTRRVHMIILLQSMTVQFRRLFWHISYYKVRQSNLLQTVKDCYYKACQVLPKCDRLLLQSVSSITKCDRLFYQVRQFLQSET